MDYKTEKLLGQIIHRMGQNHGRDLSPYDGLFLLKSLEKRLSATGIDSLAAYCNYLAEKSGEADSLFDSLHIAYSEFFRTPFTFDLLEQLILPTLLTDKEKNGQRELRVWSAACAAGQEAYSIAILLDEMVAERMKPVTFRLFATDHSAAELESARLAIYDQAALRNVRLKHLQKYFEVSGESYKVVDHLRHWVDFSVYNLLDQYSGSPAASIYGDFDLVLCGNLLFYYRADIRQQILDKIHRSLSPGGYLVTGEAEREIVAKHPGFRAIVPPSTVFRKNTRRGYQ